MGKSTLDRPLHSIYICHNRNNCTWAYFSPLLKPLSLLSLPVLLLWCSASEPSCFSFSDSLFLCKMQQVLCSHEKSRWLNLIKYCGNSSDSTKYAWLESLLRYNRTFLSQCVSVQDYSVVKDRCRVKWSLYWRVSKRLWTRYIRSDYRIRWVGGTSAHSIDLRIECLPHNWSLYITLLL